MATIKAALLDRERRVFRGMVEIDEAQVDPEIHLTAITECDLPPDQYRWEPEAGNPFGGKFVPLPPAQRAKAARPTSEHAIVFHLLALRSAGISLPDVTLMWLDDVVLSFDFSAYLDTPLLSAYIAERGLTTRKGA